MAPVKPCKSPFLKAVPGSCCCSLKEAACWQAAHLFCTAAGLRARHAGAQAQQVQQRPSRRCMIQQAALSTCRASVPCNCEVSNTIKCRPLPQGSNLPAGSTRCLQELCPWSLGKGCAHQMQQLTSRWYPWGRLHSCPVGPRSLVTLWAATALHAPPSCLEKEPHHSCAPTAGCRWGAEWSLMLAWPSSSSPAGLSGVVAAQSGPSAVGDQVRSSSGCPASRRVKLSAGTTAKVRKVSACKERSEAFCR